MPYNNISYALLQIIKNFLINYIQIEVTMLPSSIIINIFKPFLVVTLDIAIYNYSWLKTSLERYKLTSKRLSLTFIYCHYKIYNERELSTL